MADPAVLLLDEPLSSFDVVVADEMKALLRRIKTRHIILLSTHIMDLALDLCDDIVILHHGVLQEVRREGILCMGRVRVLPTIEHAALAGDAAEGCAVPKDRQLLSLQRQGFKACTVQGITDFFKVAKLTICVLGVHVRDPPVIKK